MHIIYYVHSIDSNRVSSHTIIVYGIRYLFFCYLTVLCHFSLIKMIFNRAKSNQRFPLLLEIEHAVKRNFGGLEEINVWDVFHQELFPVFPQVFRPFF